MAKFIDLKNIFKTKNPVAYKATPNFLINYLRKLIHEDDINRVMEDNKDLYGLEFLDAVIAEMDPHITYEGLDNIPEKGGAIIVANHPLGGLDGLALMHVVGQRREDVYFLVNDILMSIKNFGHHFVPVNKMGKNSAEYNERIESVFNSDGVVIVFPAGLVSRRKKGVVKDLLWKKGFVTRAKKYQKNIVPTYIEGRLSNRFYKFANARTGLGVGVNLELLLLPDEMFKQKNEDIHITFGKEISYEMLSYDRHTPEEWSAIFKEYIYVLKDEPEAEFESFLQQNNY